MQSIKEKITAKLPGHNKDANHNGVPDRLEGNTASRPIGGLGFGQTGFQSGMSSDLNRNGIPDQLEGGRFQQGGLQSGFSSDLNRNGIPDQLEGGQTWTNTYTTTVAPVVDVREAPTVIQKLEKAPVIHEVIRTEEVVEVQPVIEREREKLDVYEVVQPIREREVVATEVRTAVLPAQTRSAVIEDQSAFLAQRSLPVEMSTRDVAPTLHTTHQNAPIIHETITHKVVEEVQPVIYKEIERPVLIKETLPIYEKIVEAPHSHHTVLPMRDLGTRSVGTTFTTGYSSDLNRNGIPDSMERGFQSSGLLSQPQIIQGGLGQSGFSSDLNRNGIPDQLEGGRMGSTNSQHLSLKDKITSKLPGHKNQDKNFNGVPDRLEGSTAAPLGGMTGFGQTPFLGQQGYQSGMSSDLNRNGIPDQLEGGRFQQGGFQSGLLGQQGYQSGMSSDLNRNGIPDSMERQSGYQSGLLPQQSGFSSDLNGNGIPDRMEKRSLNDLNGNGLPDSLESRLGSTNLGSQTY